MSENKNIEDDKVEEILEENNENEELEENDRLNDLEEELINKEQEFKEIKDSFIRLQADFTNFKKRSEQDKKNTIKFAKEGIMLDLLPVIDNFERALKTIEDQDNIYEGVNLIYTQFLEVLKTNGLEKIDAIGKEFDPNFHHAVIMEESDKYKEGCVLEVLQEGYLLNDKVIRPSMVKVVQ